MRGKFCPKCGATDKPFHKGFCIDCFVKDHPGLVQIEDAKLKQCSRCLRVYARGEWEKGNEDSVIELLGSKVKTSLGEPEVTIERTGGRQNNEEFDVTVTGLLGDERISLTQPVTVKYDKDICPVCSRKSGNYYEAIFQLRPKGKAIDLDRLKTALIFLRNEARAQSKKDRKAEIFRFEQVKSGIDVYFGSARSAKVALQHLQATYKPVVKESYTLRGVDKETGKNRYSVTYSVRL